MAKILLSTVSGIPNSKSLPCFYEGFVNALLREGNDVMLMITNHFHTECWKKNTLLPYIHEEKLYNEIMDFNPDLVIAFNNSLSSDIPHLLECPIAVWSADSPPYYCDAEKLKDRIDRYHFICACDELFNLVIDYFNAKPSQVHTIQFATDFMAEPLEQDHNISFIGTNFSAYCAGVKDLFYTNFYQEPVKNDFIKFMEAYKKDALKSPQFYLQQLSLKEDLLKSLGQTEFLNLLSGNFRTQSLLNICDLGLHLYGDKNWYELVGVSVDLALCYHEKEVSSVSDNQNLYNKSKIAINITHAQTKKAFGWRVRDIMATNACLVSDYRAELNQQFGKYVKIPTYETPYEARIICQKLLKDNIWRKEIVMGSQLAIEEEHRFKHRFRDLENIFNIRLFTEKTGTLVQLNAENFIIRKKDVMKWLIPEVMSLCLLKLIKIKQNKILKPLYQCSVKILPYSFKVRVKDMMLIKFSTQQKIKLDDHTKISISKINYMVKSFIKLTQKYFRQSLYKCFVSIYSLKSKK